MGLLQKYRTNINQNNSSLPLLNSLFVDRFSELNPYSQDNNFKTYMKWTRRSPALIGFINIIATDMIGDHVDFISLDDIDSKTKVSNAQQFWDSNQGAMIEEETIYDMLLDGIGYNWLGLIDDVQIKEFCKTSISSVYINLESKELEFKANNLMDMIKSKNKEALPQKLRHIAASTMTIHTDEYKVLKYIQRVGVNIKRFDPKEIIVFKLMPFDGKVYPFPPMEAILSEVYLLWLITQNYVSFFENGGKPDNVFILPKEIAGSKNHEYLIETLKKYKKIQNKHGNLVFTGDLSIEKLMEVEHQMENKDLGLYLVSIMAMMYGVPVNRIPFLVGKASSKGDSGGLADSGYWRKISVWQSKLEAPLNLKLFEPFFGVKMKFRRGYLQDEVRETQTEIQKTSIAEQRIDLGLWTVEAAGKYLKIDESVIKEAQEQKKQRAQDEMRSGLLLQNQENNDNVMREEDARLKAKQKQDTQKKNQQDSGGKKINP